LTTQVGNAPVVVGVGECSVMPPQPSPAQSGEGRAGVKLGRELLLGDKLESRYAGISTVRVICPLLSQ
jgi:hypothetical protein